MNTYLSEEFFKIIFYTLLCIEIFPVSFWNEFWSIMNIFDHLLKCKRDKITDYTPDSVIG